MPPTNIARQALLSRASRLISAQSSLQSPEFEDPEAETYLGPPKDSLAYNTALSIHMKKLESSEMAQDNIKHDALVSWNPDESLRIGLSSHLTAPVGGEDEEVAATFVDYYQLAGGDGKSVDVFREWRDETDVLAERLTMDEGTDEMLWNNPNAWGTSSKEIVKATTAQGYHNPASISCTIDGTVRWADPSQPGDGKVIINFPTPPDGPTQAPTVPELEGRPLCWTCDGQTLTRCPPPSSST